MAKLTLSDLVSLTNETSAISTINANMALIEDALENTHSRDGTTPNELEANLDMNSFRILNLLPGTTDGEPVTIGQVQDLIDITAAGIIDGDFGDITVSGVGQIWTINNDAVTYAKMQNVSATDRILGRSSGGAGDVQEITCTAAGRALIDDANAAAQLTTLGAYPAAGGTISGSSAITGGLTVGTTLGVTGAATVGGTLGVTGASTFTSVSGTTATFSSTLAVTGIATFGDLVTIGDNGDTATAFRINGAAGSSRQFNFQTAGVLRWAGICNSTAESGANAGSDYSFNCYSDAGSLIGQCFTVTRSTRVTNFLVAPTVAGSTMWHAGNDGAGSGCDADTVDGIQAASFVQTGITNTFTVAQAIALAANGTALTLSSTSAGAASASLDFDHNSASPAVSDVTGSIKFYARDSGNNLTQYGSIDCITTNVTDTTEGATIGIAGINAGTLNYCMYFKGGQYSPSATGGDKGAGTINAGAVYDDNVLLTCMALQKEFIDKGTIDLDKWNNLVPNRIIPAKTTKVPVMETKTFKKMILEDSAEGKVLKEVTVTEKVQASEFIPVFDEKGNGIEAIEEKLFDEVIEPEYTERTYHTTALAFKELLDTGFDPRNPDQFFDYISTHNALPGMPTQANWEHNSLSVGEMFSKKWLATEMIALVMRFMWLKLKTMDDRITALEGA